MSYELPRSQQGRLPCTRPPRTVPAGFKKQLSYDEKDYEHVRYYDYVEDNYPKSTGIANLELVLKQKLDSPGPGPGLLPVAGPNGEVYWKSPFIATDRESMTKRQNNENFELEKERGFSKHTRCSSDQSEYEDVSNFTPVPAKHPVVEGTSNFRKICGCAFLILVVLSVALLLVYFLVIKTSADHSNSHSQTSSKANDSSQCSSGYIWFEQTGYCYKAYPIGVTFPEAKNSCSSDDAQLTSIHSELESVFIAGLYHTEHLEVAKKVFFKEKHSIWLGLHRPNVTWEWMDGSRMDFAYWSTEDYSDNTTVPATTMSHSGIQWIRRNSDNMFGFVCKKPPLHGIKGNTTSTTPVHQLLSRNDKCIMGYDWLEPLSSCYMISITNTNFADAERSCKEDNGNLVSVHSRLENVLLAGLVMKAFQFNGLFGKEEISKLWIGLMVKDRSYTWTDDSPLDYFYWWPSEPTYMKRKDMFRWTYWSAWQPAEPTQTSGFICKMGDKSN